jgi:hypothetical protein
MEHLMKSLTTAAALVALTTFPLSAATTTFEINLDFSIGFGTPVETWTIGLTYDPETYLPTSVSPTNFNRSSLYQNVNAYLKKGSQTATLDNLDISFSSLTSLGNRHSLTFIFTIDDRSTWGAPPLNHPGGASTFDGDQDDGLDFGPTNRPQEYPVDLNQMTINFFAPGRVNGGFFFPDIFRLTDSFDYLEDAPMQSVSGSIFGIRNSTGGQASSNLFQSFSSVPTYTGWSTVTDTGGGVEVGTVPLPPAGLTLAAGLLVLAGLRRRRA